MLCVHIEKGRGTDVDTDMCIHRYMNIFVRIWVHANRVRKREVQNYSNTHLHRIDKHMHA